MSYHAVSYAVSRAVSYAVSFVLESVSYSVIVSVCYSVIEFVSYSDLGLSFGLVGLSFGPNCVRQSLFRSVVCQSVCQSDSLDYLMSFNVV